jgi:hypothetical protein
MAFKKYFPLSLIRRWHLKSIFPLSPDKVGIFDLIRRGGRG